ncbi:MAG: DNA repair protein RecO [Clostridia bacterium]|nr:DNA repair protein RecO [Clostridia bacterium]
MKDLKTKAIVVRTTDYKDYDRLVTLITDNLGKITVLMKGCRKPTAKLRFASVPMFFGEYILNETAGRYTVTGCDCIEPFYNLSQDIDSYYCACCMLQTLDRVSQDGENTAPVLSILVRHLAMLTQGAIPSYEVLIRFIDAFTIEGGYSVGLTTCRMCGDRVIEGVSTSEGVSCKGCKSHSLDIIVLDASVMEYLYEVLTEQVHSRVISRDLIQKSLKFVFNYQNKLLGVKINAFEEYLKVLNL